MRILSVNNCGLDETLGSGYVIANYVRRLRERGHEIVTLSPKDYEWLPRMRGAKRLRILLGLTSATLRAVRREHFDVVELWGAESWRAAERLARKREHPVLIGRSNGLETHFVETLAAHGLAENTGVAARWLDRWQRIDRAFRCVDGLTTVSHFDRRFALERGYQPVDRLLTIENPLPDDWLGQTVEADRPEVIGFFGSWLPNKGGTLLVEALPEVLRAHPGWRMRFVGVGAASIKECFPPELASRVEVVPFERDRARLKALYHQTAVIAMPSAYESFGLVATEALSCGCALVAGATGFAADLRPDLEVAIVAERTSAAWRSGLMNLLADESRRRRIAAGGHARVQSLRWSNAVDALEVFYTRLADRRLRRS